MPAITINDLNNAKTDVDHIAEIANSVEIEATDRLGHIKDTISGAVYKITTFTNRGAWVAARAYAVKDLVSVSGSWYVAVVAHTSSGAFATDSASKWRLYQGVTTGDLSAPTGAGIVGFRLANGTARTVADLSAAAGAEMVGVLQLGTGAVARTAQEKFRDVVSVKDFGAKGDGVTDDRPAIILGDAACYAMGKVLNFPAGVYRCSDGIPNKKAKWQGAGAPALGTFPLVDDKIFLRPGYKTQLPGTTLLFTGTGTQAVSTQRPGYFSAFTYCVKTAPGVPSSIKGLAIVQDMDAQDAGGAWTTWATDNRANYGVGYMVDDSPRCAHDDFVVFGYFSVAGIVLLSKETAGYLGDPDYCSFNNGATSGNIGLALIGSATNDGFDSGLSGTNCLNFDIFSKDHHSRDNTVDDWGMCCLYIDGHTDAINNDINGHYFVNGVVRTYGKNPIILDHASHTQFVSTVFETPKRSTPNSSTTQFLASANTNDVAFIGCRYSDDAGLYNPEFGGSMKGQLINVGGPFGGVMVSEKDADSSAVYTVRLGGASAGTGRPAIQFLTGSPTSSTNGWVIARDPSALDQLDFKWNNVSTFSLMTGGGVGKFGLAFGGSKVIAAGAIAVGGYSYYAVDTEASAATDDLTTITGGTFAGQRLVLRASNGSRDVVLKDATGNLRLAGDFTLTNGQDRIELEWDGATWIELSRSDNTV
jgi:hypothetical protein